MQTKLQTIKSSKITWYVLDGAEWLDFVKCYCADGDGILQLEEHKDGSYALNDQGEIVKTWTNVSSNEDFLAILELAQSYLAATYHEIFEDAKHHGH
jgi:hypothetical protein